MKKILISVFVTAVLVGGGAFYGGMKYGQSKVPQRFANLSQEQRQQFQQTGADIGGLAAGRGQRGSGFASGEIIAKDEKSITIKLPGGGSKIIFYSDSAEIGKFEKGNLDDLEVGKTITVNGEANSDGSITAQSIQIRPEGISPLR